MASACAAAGLESRSCSTPVDRADAALPAAAHGARVFLVRGTYDDCRRLELGLEGLFPWGFLEGNLHAFAIEGAKTIAYEIAEQLGGEAPDAVVCPIASGTLFAKLAQGFAELAELRLLNGSAPPRLFGAQPEGCHAGGDGVGRRAAAVARDAGHDRRVARRRRPEARRSRARRGPDLGRRHRGGA